MPTITINGNSLDPLTQAHALRAFGLEAQDATKSDFIIIQTKAPLSDEQKDEFDKLGIVVHEYVSENTYLCGYKPTDLKVIRALPYVVWANVYIQQFVIAPELKAASAAPASASTSSILPSLPAPSKSRIPRTVDIVVHNGVDPKDTKFTAALAAVANADESSLTIGRDKIRLTVQEQYLDALAALDQVRAIQEVRPVKMHNNMARNILRADFEANGVAYKAEGQVVAVADTGFDLGSTEDTHPAFTGRVKKLYPLGRPRTGKADDPNGHGTHVCGSVLGDGNSATMGGRIEAAASKATLVLQSLLDDQGGFGGVPFDLETLFETPYNDDNARVHTNSWGAVNAGRYDSSSTAIDRFVFEHPDLVILFAAGNDGADHDGSGVIDPAQIGTEAAAKNCITVGASENNRPNIQGRYGDFWSDSFPEPPLSQDLMADSPEGLAAFSSRGPTKERRIKPDVVAPGTAILSTRSRASGAAPSTFGVSTDPQWMFLGGTSMATPLVAGCVAVLREALIKNGTANPSAALIKALLINGAAELHGQYVPSEAGPSPNNNSGYGLVNLSDSIILPGERNAGFGEGRALKQGQEETLTLKSSSGNTPALQTQDGAEAPEASSAVATTSPLQIPAAGATLKVTLVWTDPPGERLQNDLDLIVRAADGTEERHGNMGAGKKTFDRLNNVEQVCWVNVPPGEVTVVVRAYRITLLPQKYAYAWRVSG